jgi:hypothetical protein
MKLVSQFSTNIVPDFLALSAEDRVRFLATLLERAAPHIPAGFRFTSAYANERNSATLRAQIESVLVAVPGGPL